MKTNFIILMALLTGPFLFGQSMVKQTLSQHGSAEFIYANNKSYFFQQSIGQASVINTFNTENYQLRQGFLQPLKAALINSGFDNVIDVIAYPNPFDETLTLNFQETLIDVITISLHHITGQLIHQDTYLPNETISLQFDALPIGAYVLRGQMRSQTFVIKLIKQ